MELVDTLVCTKYALLTHQDPPVDKIAWPLSPVRVPWPQCAISGSIWPVSCWTSKKRAVSWHLVIKCDNIPTGWTKLNFISLCCHPGCTSGWFMLFEKMEMEPRTMEESESIFNDGREFLRLYVKLAMISLRTFWVWSIFVLLLDGWAI